MKVMNKFNLLEQYVYQIDYQKDGVWYPYNNLEFNTIMDTNEVIDPDSISEQLYINNYQVECFVYPQRIHFGYKYLPQCLKWINEHVEESIVVLSNINISQREFETKCLHFDKNGKTLEESWETIKQYNLPRVIEDIIKETEECNL